MWRKTRLFMLSVSLVLGLAACQSAGTGPTTAPSATASNPATHAAEATATVAATRTAGKGPTATAAPADTGVAATSAPAPKGFPPQTSAAAITPPDRRPELTLLSNLLKFKVVGLDNAPLGSIADFVINTCETYVIYFALDPDPALKVAAGKQLIIPYEAVTINSGGLDAAAKTISLHLVPSQLAAAPASPSPLALLPDA